MRKWLGLAGLMSLLLAGISCDSDQPLTAGEQNFSVAVQAVAAADIYHVWDVQLDSDGDGTPDTPAAEPSLCIGPLGLDTGVVVPWRFSAELAVVRAGTTTKEIVATSLDPNADTPYSSVTPYDTRILNTLANFTNPNRPGEFFVNGRRITTANRDFLVAVGSQARSTALGVGNNVCPNLTNPNLPDPNVLGQSPTFELALSAGDTVTFKARKQRIGSAGVLNRARATAPSLSAFTFVEGLEVNQVGSASSGTEDGGGFAFSFTLQ